jgi:hypothetical protein
MPPKKTPPPKGSTTRPLNIARKAGETVTSYVNPKGVTKGLRKFDEKTKVGALIKQYEGGNKK